MCVLTVLMAVSAVSVGWHTGYSTKALMIICVLMTLCTFNTSHCKGDEDGEGTGE